jgi:hypothetical protein
MARTGSSIQQINGGFTRIINVLSARGYVPIWADFNRDGRPDLLITAKTAREIGVFDLLPVIRNQG